MTLRKSIADSNVWALANNRRFIPSLSAVCESLVNGCRAAAVWLHGKRNANTERGSSFFKGILLR